MTWKKLCWLLWEWKIAIKGRVDTSDQEVGDTTNIQPRGLQVWIQQEPSFKFNLWIPEFYKAFPRIGLGAEVGWTKKYKNKLM